MTFDNETRAIVTRTVEEVLDSWRDHDSTDFAVLTQAADECVKKLKKALNRGNWDEINGVADRLSSYANKLNNMAKKRGHSA